MVRTRSWRPPRLVLSSAHPGRRPGARGTARRAADCLSVPAPVRAADQQRRTPCYAVATSAAAGTSMRQHSRIVAVDPHGHGSSPPASRQQRAYGSPLPHGHGPA